VSARRAYSLTLLAGLTYTSLTFCWFTLPASLPAIQQELSLTGTQAGLVAGAVPLAYIPLALVSTLFPPDETGPASSLYLLCASAGTAGAFSLGAPVLAPALGGWRPLFLASGVVAFAYALAWAVVTWVAVPAVETDSEFRLVSLTDDLRAILANRSLRLVVVLGVVYLSVLHGLQGWLPTLLEARGMADGPASQTATLLVGANAVGILTIPTLADRYDAREGAVICCGGAVTVGVAAIAVTDVGFTLLAGIVCAGLGVGGLSPLVRAIPPELDGVGPRLTGVAVGFVFAGGEIGGFGGPFAIGTLHDLTGSYAAGLGLLCLGGVAAVVAGALLRV